MAFIELTKAEKVCKCGGNMACSHYADKVARYHCDSCPRVITKYARDHGRSRESIICESLRIKGNENEGDS